MKLKIKHTVLITSKFTGEMVVDVDIPEGDANQDWVVGSTIKEQFLSNPVNQAAMENLKAEFEASHPEVEIEARALIPMVTKLDEDGNELYRIL